MPAQRRVSMPSLRSTNARKGSVPAAAAVTGRFHSQDQILLRRGVFSSRRTSSSASRNEIDCDNFVAYMPLKRFRKQSSAGELLTLSTTTTDSDEFSPTDILEFGEAIREGNMNKVEAFIQSKGTSIIKSVFHFDIRLQYAPRPGNRDAGSVSAQMSLSALHLAIVSGHPDFVSYFLAVSSSTSDEKLMWKILSLKTKILFNGKHDALSKSSQLLHNLNPIHLSAKYDATSLDVIAGYCEDCASQVGIDSISKLVDDQDNPLKMSPLHLAAKNRSATATT